MLRQRQVAARRNNLMDAAESLIRLTHSTDFTMLAVAETAGVSPTTPYNLFESKAGLLYALLNRSMDGVDMAGQVARMEAEPFERAIRCAKAAAELFTSDPAFYRVLYQCLLGVDDPIHRPAFMDRAHSYWKQAAQALELSGLLPSELSRNELALEMEIHFLGVLDLWVHGELNDRQFIARAVHGATLLLLGLSTGKARTRLLKHLRNSRRMLPTIFSFSASDRVREAPGRRHKHEANRDTKTKGTSARKNVPATDKKPR